MTLDEALDLVSVVECDEMNSACREAKLPQNHPKGWYGVVNSYGVIAYFKSDKRAFRYRLEEVNRILNG